MASTLDLDPERALALAYVPAQRRPAVEALWRLDVALGAVVAKAGDPMVARIRLAWWREALERLDTNPPPPEPRLQAVATDLLPRGFRGASLAKLEDGWATMFDEEPDVERLLVRGALLFDLGARLLGATDPLIAVAGRLYAQQAYRHWGLAPLHWPMEEMHQLHGHRFPRRLRPLTALARLAARDARQSPTVEPEATPGRAAALLAHRLTGRVN